MLYRHRNDPSLTEELFRAPGAEYRGAPFWAWNTHLEPDELERQIDIFREMGIGGFHMHSRSGMATPYLSDEFMALTRRCMEKAKRENMLCWLYDEDRWPSGAAGGLVTCDYRYRARSLVFAPAGAALPNGLLPSRDAYYAALEEGGKPAGYHVARYAVSLDADGFLSSYRLLADGEEGADFIAYVRISGDAPWFNGQAYLDTLSPAAVRRFMEVTHERYYETLGDEFGRTVPAIFTDEPQFTRRQFYKISGERHAIQFPWTDDLEDTYRAAYGASLLGCLPELVWELPGGAVSRARWCFADHVCERFTAAFADQLGAWCEKHGIALTGHMMEEPTLLSQSSAVGEAMRAYRSFQLPGIDILCARVELTTAKQTASAVHQYGREGMLSELYGVTGWHYDLRSHKEQGDWQAALGVTVRVHHLTWVSMNGEAKRDYPASIGYQSPWYKKYSAVEDHFARLNTALTRGRPSVRIGVLHPIESYWLHCGPMDKTASRRAYLDERFQTLTSSLLYGGLDFDFISESLLPSLCPEGSFPLRVGEMRYDVIVVPVMETMRRTTLERLKAFSAAGGQVIVLGTPPSLVDACPSPDAADAAKRWTCLDADMNALLDALAPYRFLSLTDLSSGARASTLIHQVRDDGDGKWLFLCHGAPVETHPLYMPAQDCERIRITLDGLWDVRVYDTLSGKTYTPSYDARGGRTVLEYAFYAADSLLLRLTPRSGEGALPADAPSRPLPGAAPDITAASSKAPRKVVRQPRRIAGPLPYTLEEPNALLLDFAEFAFDGGEWEAATDSILIADIGRARFYDAYQGQRIVQPWVPEPEAVRALPPHTVRRRFRFRTEIPLDGAHLALEMPDGARLRLNGEEIAAAPDGWYVDKCIRTIPLPHIPAGDAVIEIEQPFSLRSSTEWCYLTGAFGVRLTGDTALVTALPEKLYFGDAATQGLPFYTGNLVYHASLGGDADVIHVARFGGAAAGVSFDGGAETLLPYPPYCAAIPEGARSADIRVYGTRANGFGALHNCVPGYSYWGPNSWRTHGTPGFTTSYMLRPSGLLDAPNLF